MKASILVVAVAAVAVGLAVPALGTGGGDARKVLDAKVLAPVVAPYTGSSNPIRDLAGGGKPWQISSGEATLRADGSLHVEVEGLVLVATQANPFTQLRAVVSCQTIDAGAAAVANVETPLVPASSSGDAEIDTTVALPSPCYAPIVFVTSPGDAWFAVSGR